VEVIVQALAGDRLEPGVATGLVVPRTIGEARLHGGEDMDQTGVIATCGEDRVDPIRLTERLKLVDEFNLKHSLGGEAFGVGAQWLGPAGIIEQTKVANASQDEKTRRFI
jgi:hypothetical protein